MKERSEQSTGPFKVGKYQNLNNLVLITFVAALGGLLFGFDIAIITGAVPFIRVQFDEFCLPVLQKEVKAMSQNVFHCDGKGVANHIDRVLEIPEVNTIQWVQDMAEDQPIMQWIPLIRKIQVAGKFVIVDLQLEEPEPFMSEVSPEGIFIWVAVEEQLQPDIIKKLTKWH